MAISSWESIPPTISASLNSIRPTRLQDAKYLSEYCGPAREMAQNVIRKYRVKGVVAERETLRNVTLLESRL